MPPDQFTEDIIFDILTHASVETIGRCRAVSRKWNRVTYEPSFMDLHPHRARTIAGYFVQGPCDGSFSTRFMPATGETRNLSLGFLPGPMRIEACDRGILLCRKLVGSATAPSIPEYYACKPSTKEWVRIPSPRTGSFPAATAMVLVRSKPNPHFKVLRISMGQKPGTRKQHCCEIFDSEAWKWKRLADMAVPCERKFVRENPVVVAGKAFWFTGKRHVLAFDMYEETWSAFPVSIPDLDTSQYLTPRLVKHEGKLGLLFQCRNDDDFVDLFVMENLSRRAWGKRRRICFRGIGRPFRRLLAIYSDNVFLMQGFYEILLCRSHGETASVIKSSRIDMDGIFAFCSDLEPGNLKASGKSFEEIVSLPCNFAGGMVNLLRKWVSMPCWMNVTVPGVFLIVAAGYVMF